MESEYWNEVGFVLASEPRRSILIQLSRSAKTPKQLSEECDIAINHISNYLKQLAEKDMITCLNPEMKKGRLYETTEKGKMVAIAIIKIIK